MSQTDAPSDQPDIEPTTARDPQLRWAEDGAPRSGRFNDVYFSRDDGLSETRAVFLDGCGLPEAWQGRKSFCVAELGFGTGLNIAALLDLWRANRPTDGHLSVFSVEGYPLSVDEARRALAHWPQIAEAADALLKHWPAATPGFHRIDLPDWHATIDLAIGQVDWALNQWSGQADAWFLDGFSPALNPGMWSDDVLAAIARHAKPDARLATFTVAGHVRRGLSAQGFEVAKRPGHGKKRERLEARLRGPASTPPEPSVIIIGAGIAGASVALALSARGVSPTVIEALAPGAGASGFPASLVTPRMDAGDEQIAALYAQALRRARDLYRRTPDAVVQHGVLQLEQTPRDANRFDKIAAQTIWSADEMQRLSPEQVSARIGEQVDVGGLLMTSSMTIHAVPVIKDWLKGASVVTSAVEKIEHVDGQWSLLDADGATIAAADVVVLAAGAGSGDLTDYPLRPVRGQANWVADVTSPAIAWGGYAAPTVDGLLFGATHDRDQTDSDCRPEDTLRNQQALAARLPALAARIDGMPIKGRAAVRSTTPDRLPLAGPVAGSPGLFLSTGHGSRGFCMAPLLGEHLAALIMDAPSPLPVDLAKRLAPDRFAKG